MNTKIWLLLLTFCLLCIGCNDTAEPITNPTPTIQPQEELGEFNDPLDLSEPQPSTNDSTSLRIWTPVTVWETTDDTIETSLTTLFESFTDEYPLMQLDIQFKELDGLGNMFGYFKTGKNIALQILPDAVLIPAELLPNAVANEWVYPLTIELPDSYPIAKELVIFESEIMGIPIGLEPIPHLVTIQQEDESTPFNWDSVKETVQTEEGNEQLWYTIALQLYRTNDPSGWDDVTTWKKVLVALQDIPTPSDLPITTLVDELSEEAPYAIPPSTQSIGEISDREYAPLPGFGRYTNPYTTGWVWAVTTEDPNRQSMVLELLQFIENSSQFDAWLMENEWLPTTTTQMVRWPKTPYREFVRGQLEEATALPISAEAVTVLNESLRTVWYTADPDLDSLAQEISNSIP